MTATERATEAAAEVARLEAEIKTTKQRLEDLYGDLWQARADRRAALSKALDEEKETDE